MRRALDILGLDETVDAAAIKAQYKALVKRFHPDANGGDRSFEERLRDIIKAHDTAQNRRTLLKNAACRATAPCAK